MLASTYKRTQSRLQTQSDHAGIHIQTYTVTFTANTATALQQEYVCRQVVCILDNPASEASYSVSQS